MTSMPADQSAQPVCHQDNFSGEPRTKWSDWEKQFSRVAVLSAASNPTRKVALLSAYLKGAALSFYGKLKRRTPALMADWTAWSTAFLESFPDNRQVEVKYEQLVARSQRTGESVSSFAVDIRRLGKRAFPSWTGVSEYDSIIINHFITRLVPNIRR